MSIFYQNVVKAYINGREANIYEINESLLYFTDSEITLDLTNSKEPNDLKEPTSEYTYSDLDNDGKITSADSLLILRASVKLENFDEVKTKLADVDGNCNVSSADALEVLRASVGLPTKGNIGEKYK